MVKGRIGHETWRLVHLNEPRLAFSIDKNVDAKDLDAQLIFQILRLSRLLNVRDVVMASDHSLDGQLFQKLPTLLT